MAADKPFDKFHSSSQKQREGSVTASDKVNELKDVLKGKKEGGSLSRKIPVRDEDEASLKDPNRELPEADRELLDEEIKVLGQK